MANERLHLIHVHSSTVKVPDSNADLRYGEIAVQYATSDPALYIKKADDTYAKFTPESDITVTPSGSGNVVSNVSASGHVITITKINAVTSATGDALISATVNGTQVAVSATSGLSQAVADAHTHENKNVLDGITSGKVANWDEAYSKEHEHSNKALLDTYTQTEANLADAVAKKHEHDNKEELDLIQSGDVAKWNASAEKSHEHSNKTVLDGITSGKVSNWDSAYSDMLTGITRGTDGNFVTTTVGAKSSKSQSVSVAVTTAATSAATSTANGLATAYETKQYIDKEITAATSGQVTKARTITAGTGLTGGGNLSQNRTIAHKTVAEPTPATSSATVNHGGTFTAITALKEDGLGHVTATTATTFTIPGTEITAATGDNYVGASYNSSTKTVTVSADVATNISAVSSSDTQLADAYAVKQYLEGQMASAVQYMGATSTLPSSPSTGDLYVAGANIAIPAGSSATGAAVTAETGDFIIARSNGKWDVIEKNLDGAVTTTVSSLTDGAVIVGNGNKTIKVSGAKGDATHPIYIDANGKPQTANTIHSVSASDGTNILAWDSNVTLATVTVDGTAVTIDAKLPANPNTDTKVTAVGNHYTPEAATQTGGTTTTSAASAVKGITYDDAGHIVGVVTGSVLTGITVANKNATIGSSTVTAATVAGTDITMKVDTGITVANAAKVNNHTVETNVPAGAVFTDTTYTFASGTNGSFTVTPAGGSAQTVSIGKPASASSADTATTAVSANKVKAAFTVTSGTTSGSVLSYDGSSAQSINITSANATIGTDLTTIATVAGVNIQAKVPAAATPHTLTIAGAAASAADATYNTTADVTITTLDCGEY